MKAHLLTVTEQVDTVLGEDLAGTGGRRSYVCLKESKNASSPRAIWCYAPSHPLYSSQVEKVLQSLGCLCISLLSCFAWLERESQ